MTAIVQVHNFEKPTKLRIEYMVGNTCNFKCSYCFPMAHAGTHKYFDDYDLLLKNMLHLMEHYSKNGKTEFEVNYVGGEPTLWPRIAEFSRELKKHYNCFISINTNASRTLRWWDENGDAFDKIKMSCHHEQVDIDHYIAVADLLYEKGLNLNALVLMDSRHWDKCVGIIEKCKQSKYPWFVNAMEVYSEYTYTPEQSKYISSCVKRRPSIWWILKHEKILGHNPKVTFENGTTKTVKRNWMSLNDLNRFKGWECNLGIDIINIQHDGKISGTCHMKLFGEQEYYNVYDQNFVEKFTPELKPVICEFEKCWCQPEQLLDKVKLDSKKVIPLLVEYPTNKYTSS